MRENPAKAQNGAVANRVGDLCRQLASQARSKCEREYVENLENSYHSLVSQGSGGQADVYPIGDADAALLNAHLINCREYLQGFDATFDSILEAAHGLVPHTQHCPRMSPTLILRQLNKERFTTLSNDWKAAIVEYGLAITQLHRAQRLVLLTERPQDLLEELRNPGHQNWDPMEFPEHLLLEAESGILIREVQEEIAKQMRDPSENRNAVMQLNMGEGKSSVIVPVCAADLADGLRYVYFLFYVLSTLCAAANRIRSLIPSFFPIIAMCGCQPHMVLISYLFVVVAVHGHHCAQLPEGLYKRFVSL